MAFKLHTEIVMLSALRNREGKLLGLALVVLVVSVGFCLFDGDHEDGYPGLDLCLGMLAASMAATLVSRLPLTGLASPDRLTGVLEFSPLVPAPPPKRALP
jgi:hypothetical protein